LAHGDHEPNKFPLLRYERGVPRCELVAEECDQPTPLVKHCADAHPGRVALHDEGLVEDQQLENGHCCESGLEGTER
jgi:hypothetical protein